MENPLRKSALTLTLALGFASLARADYTPIPLDPTGFNEDPVIEAAAPKSINDYVTVTPDQGTNKNGNTWYEIGYNTSNPTTGFPAHGSTVTAVSDANHVFQMPPDYSVNNCVFVGHGNSTWTPIQGPGTLTLTTPAPFAKLSFMTASGNGPCQVQYVIHYSDSSTETGIFTSIDWWNASTAGRIFDADGLIGMNGGVNNLTANHGSTYFADVSVGNPTLNIVSVDFYWYGNGTAQQPWSNGRSFIFGISGSTDGTTFSPIAVTGFNQDAIVEVGAAPTAGSASQAVTGVLTNGSTYCTFTMDGNTAKSGSTWFEQGYFRDMPGCGLPAAGSTFTSATQPTIHYAMPSTYAGNCAVCLASTVPTAQIKFATPTAAGGLSILAGGGNGGLNVRAEIQFSGGATETNWISVPDWFDRTDPDAYVCFGRIAAGALALNNTPDQWANVFVPAQSGNGSTVLNLVPFARDPRLVGGQQNPNIPGVRLFDLLLPVANSSGLISSINLYATNTGTFGNSVAIFAVSGSPGSGPLITSPASYVTDSGTGATNFTAGAAVLNNVTFTKGLQGNNITLWVSNKLGNAINYQWMKAPRGGGLRDIFSSFDLSTFANVTAPNAYGTTASSLVISNATLADSGDYLVVASNPYGSLTSCVASVTVLTTNSSILVGAGFGDVQTKWSADGTAGDGAETVDKAIDQAAQKWLSTGLGAAGFGGFAIPQGTVPFVGPIGYTVTPVNGASVATAIRFYAANDTPGRDPRDYLLEGSNDGSTWSTITGGQLVGTLMLPTARGGTGSTLLNPLTQPLTEVDFANAVAYKQYRITITNTIEPIATPLMQVAEIQILGTLVPNPPVWVRQPVPNVTVYAGTGPTWGVLAGGYPAPKFFWYRNGVFIPGATNSTYTLANAQLSDSGAQISCVASNSGGTITSSSSSLTVIAAPTQSYPSTILADHPLGYWRLDEGPDNFAGNDGTITVDYAGGHNGYYTNATIAVAGYNPTSDPDTAAQFGVNGPDSASVDINDVDFARGTNSAGATFSVEAWAYGGLEATNGTIVSKGYDGILLAGTGTGTEQFCLDVNGAAPKAYRFVVRDFFGNGYAAQSTVVPYDPRLNVPVWHHLVGVCDQPNGHVYLYVDGMLAASATIPSNAGILSQPLPMTIGSRQSTAASDLTDQWNGTIDDVAIYPVALSPAQILNHYEGAQAAPVFSLQPVNLHTNDNTTATLFSTAYGPGTITYQWFNSDSVNPTTPVSGATSANYTFTATPALNGNYYQVVAANAYGSVTSVVAQLIVESGAPAFVFQDLPASQVVFLGHVIQLHVAPSGTAPFTYQWQRNGSALADNYRIAGSQTDTLRIGYAGYPDTANYNCVVTGQGTTPSTTDALTVTTNSAGFFNASGLASDWTLSGTPSAAVLSTANGVNSLQMTANLGSTARAAFLNTKQTISSFQVRYTYAVTANSGAGADGVTFCIQNDTRGPAALGGGGGSLGVSGITPSVELEFNIYSPNTRGIALDTGGAIGPNVSLLPNIGIGDNANPVQVDLIYDGTTLNAKFTDTVTLLTYTTNLAVNIPSIVGGNTAYVGFTGADGGVASTQVISWSAGSAGAANRTPMTLQKVGGNLVFSWPASTGAYLQATPALGSPSPWAYDNVDTFRVVGTNATVTVTPGSGSSYYRLQLFP